MSAVVARSRPRGALRTLGMLLAIALGGVAVYLVVVGHTQKQIQIGLLVGLWGALLGAFSAFGPRRGEADETEAMLAQSERALARRPEPDQQVAVMLRREMERVLRDEVSQLRSEVSGLRNDLVEKVNGQLRLERIETTRVISSDIEELQHEVRRLAVASRSTQQAIGSPGFAPATVVETEVRTSAPLPYVLAGSSAPAGLERLAPQNAGPAPAAVASAASPLTAPPYPPPAPQSPAPQSPAPQSLGPQSLGSQSLGPQSLGPPPPLAGPPPAAPPPAPPPPPPAQHLPAPAAPFAGPPPPPQSPAAAVQAHRAPPPMPPAAVPPRPVPQQAPPRQATPQAPRQAAPPAPPGSSTPPPAPVVPSFPPVEHATSVLPRPQIAPPQPPPQPRPVSPQEAGRPAEPLDPLQALPRLSQFEYDWDSPTERPAWDANQVAPSTHPQPSPSPITESYTGRRRSPGELPPPSPNGTSGHNGTPRGNGSANGTARPLGGRRRRADGGGDDVLGRLLGR
jgi:hypothetical protein